MIVNPQLFNYRLIISSLIVIVIALSSYSYINYETLKENQAFIEQEKRLIESELSEMINRYDAVYSQNDIINEQLESSRFKTDSVLESLKALKLDVSLLSKYKRQLAILKEENILFFESLNVLKEENVALKAKANITSKKLEETKQISKKIEEQNNVLFKENESLQNTLKEAEALSLSNLTAQGVKRVTSSNRIVDTKYARRANKLHVCFTLVKNNFATKGIKDVYIQILDPKSNIVADKGVVHFGESSLIYSEKATINYKNEDVEVCSLIQADIKEPLSKGTYFVSVFHKQKRIGKTTIELK